MVHVCTCACLRVCSARWCDTETTAFEESAGHVGEQQRLVLQVYSSWQTVDGAVLLAARLRGDTDPQDWGEGDMAAS